MQKPTQKPRFNKFGYGALALYALGILVVGLGVYGANVTNMINRSKESELMRAKMRNGRMVIVNQDREQCRSYHFDNQTSDVTAETVDDCDIPLLDGRGSGSFGVFQRGFQDH